MSGNTPEPSNPPDEESAVAVEMRAALAAALGFSQLLQRRLASGGADRDALLATSEKIVAQLARLEAHYTRHFPDGSPPDSPQSPPDEP